MDEPTLPKKFFDTASFGKRIEYWIIGLMLKDGLHVFVPLVDDIGIDAIIRTDKGCLIEVQIKSRSKKCKPNQAALFTVKTVRPESRNWYVFYSEQLNKIWLMNTKQFLEHSREVKRGKFSGLRWIKFNGLRRIKATGEVEVTLLERFNEFVCEDFTKLKESPRKYGDGPYSAC
jgi:hypothetical protein